jgi:ribosomal protein S18 acetylase RimI-like enzyme
MIRYTDQLEGISPAQLDGFFEGWPNPPTPETHLRILSGSDNILLAVDDQSGNVVGFITVISDGVLSAYIPLLEVLPDYRGQGIGRELVQKTLRRLDGLYMVDLLCDPQLQPFYRAAGMQAATGMMKRSFRDQSGKAPAQ